MWKQLEVKLIGVSPLLMHNGALADPLSPLTKEMKKISGKRKKTDSDLEELARLEFQGGLYMSKNDGPVLPARVLEATIVNGAKKSREGTVAKAAMYVEKDCPLQYNGPRDREGLWADENFRFVAPVTVNRAKIMRTRPYFEEWFVNVVVSYDETQINKERVVQWLHDAGQQVGLCDWRPRYGRFIVENGLG